MKFQNFFFEKFSNVFRGYLWIERRMFINKQIRVLPVDL